MQLNSLIQASRNPINDIIEKMRENKYFVDDTFQRRLVWTEKQKVRLIETILMNYPMPEIYLWEQPSNPETGAQIHSIVDGQQRLTTLFQYTANEWHLKEAYLDASNKVSTFSNRKWKDLDDSDKRKIWEYVINIRTIPSMVSIDQIRDVFKRLNETDRSLNPQELRNAEFNGEFINVAEAISDNYIWRKWSIFKENQVRRMIDIEFASSLLIFLREGIVTDSAASINNAYDNYNDKYDERDGDLAEIISFLTYLDGLLEANPNARSFMTKTVHIYTVFAVLNILSTEGRLPQESTSKIISFINAYEADEASLLVENYRIGASSRTSSKSNREKRIEALIDWIKGN